MSISIINGQIESTTDCRIIDRGSNILRSREINHSRPKNIIIRKGIYIATIRADMAMPMQIVAHTNHFTVLVLRNLIDVKSATDIVAKNIISFGLKNPCPSSLGCNK